MKICLVNPPLVTEGASYIPLGISYMAALLEKEGYPVSVADGQCESEDQILRVVKDADVVGITCISHNFPRAIRYVQKMKEVNPTAVFIMGGPHATFTDAEVLLNTPIDVVIRHEGEYTLLEVVKALERGNGLFSIRGITYVRNDAIRRNKERSFIHDLDDLPFPARRFFNRDHYFTEDRVIQIISGRGCPFKCMFCSASSMWGHQVRLRSPESVVDEIETTHHTYGIDKFGFVDDTFTISKKNTEKICQELLDRRLSVEWGCNVRVDTLQESLVQLMKKAGCTRFFIGVESGNQKTLDFMHKKTSVPQIQETVNLAKKYSVKTTLSCILGMPNETYSEIQNTIDFMISLQGDTYIFNFLLLYPGTELYNRRKELGIRYITERVWERVEKTPFPIPTVETSKVGVRELCHLYLKAKAQLEYMKADSGEGD